MKISAYTNALDAAFGAAYDTTSTASGAVARGDSMLDESEAAQLTSIFEGITDDAWTQFVSIMATAGAADVSESNALGMFEQMPRRLADLGIVNNLVRTKRGKRTVWAAMFIPPMTSDKFLRSPQAQYRVFCTSMKDYANKIASGEIEKPKEISLSGALAICHKAGPNGLKSWVIGDRFPATEAIFQKAQGVF